MQLSQLPKNSSKTGRFFHTHNRTHYRNKIIFCYFFTYVILGQQYENFKEFEPYMCNRGGGGAVNIFNKNLWNASIFTKDQLLCFLISSNVFASQMIISSKSVKVWKL